MKPQYTVLAILLLTFSICNGQENKRKITFPFLDSITKVKLIDKKEVRKNIGCIVEHSTAGEVEFQRILNDSSVSKDIKSKLIEFVLSNNNFYHLHRLAGNAIQGDDSFKLNVRNTANSDYFKLRTSITIEDEIFYGGGDFDELKFDKINELIMIIDNRETKDASKKYFIEVLYSLTSKPETGKLIFDRINKLDINESIKLYNRKLFKSFQLYKPVYEHLNSIITWKEMNKNKSELEKLFSSKQPIMFFQILSQNPSTVLNSKKLSKLKNDALLSIIHTSTLTSFFRDLRIFYLVQFLIEENYSIRFIDTIMAKNEKKKYLNQLETE